MTREQYLAAREQLKPKEFWADMDHWPLFAGTKNILRYLFIAKLVERTMLIPGDIAEFGCWRGSTTSLMAKILSANPHGRSKIVHAFDTFAGFDEQVQQDKQLRSGYKGSLNELQELLLVNGAALRVQFHVGDICEIIPKLNAEDFDYSLSLAYIDVDVYEPCKAALRWAHRALSSGGIIAFDEYNDPFWPGETRAVKEFLAEQGTGYLQESTPVEQPSLVLVKK